MKKRHFHAGYSIIEVVAVLVLLLILTGAGIWSVGNVHNTELFGKISQDLARINSAKVAWRTAHPEDAFLPTEGERFVLLQPYLKSGLLQVDTLLPEFFLPEHRALEPPALMPAASAPVPAQTC